MAGRIRALDATAASSRPSAAWPQSLRTAVELMLDGGMASAIQHGPDGVLLYNDAWVALLGSRAGPLGGPGLDRLGAMWPGLRPHLHGARSGESSTAFDQPLSLERDGRVETSWLSISCAPVRDQGGEVIGVFVTARDMSGPRRDEAPRRAGPAPYGGDVGLAVLVRFGRAVARMAAREDIWGEAGRVLREELGAARVVYAVIEPDGGIEAADASLAPGLSSTASRPRLSDLGLAPGDAAPRATSGDPDGAAAAWVSAPVVVDGRLRAALRVELAGPHAWTADELVLIEAIAERTWTEVTRAAAERALAEERRDIGRLRQLAAPRDDLAALDEELVAAAVAMTGADGGMLVAVESTTGLPVVLAARGATDEMVASVRETADRSTALAAALAGGGRVALDHQAQGEPGERAYLAAGFASSEATPLVTRAGEVIGALSTHWRARRRTSRELAFFDLLTRQAADLVDARRGHQAAREAIAVASASRQAAERASRSRDDFLALLSHELRTPLAPILLWGRMLLGGRVPLADISRAIEAIVTSAESQSRLVEELLDLSRITAGRLSLSREPTDIAAVAAAAIEVVRPTAEAKQQGLRVELDDGLGAALLDPRRFQQVLWNLLTNAVKFTPEGGQVSVHLWRDGTSLVGEVADSGEGMTPQLIARAFERFYQANMADERAHGGLGIGLALCRELVQMHGGTIEARSPGPGRGSVFTFRIPLGAEPVSLPAPPVAPARPERPLSQVGVLLVEDDRPTREAMQWVLERAGACVVAVSSGDQALAVLVPPVDPAVDVIVCDLGLPGLDGYDLIEQIEVARRARGEASIPACAVSAHVRVEDRQRALDAGFSLHLGKPIAGDALVDAVRELAHAPAGGGPS